LEILGSFEGIDETAFTEKTADFYKKIMKTVEKKEVEETSGEEVVEVVETEKEETSESE